MDLTDRFHDHPSEETLEAYVLHHLEEDEEGRVEEHLLLCSHCQRSIAELDEYVALMKSATVDQTAQSSRPPRWERVDPFVSPAAAAVPNPSHPGNWWSSTQFAAAAAVILLIAASVLWFTRAPEPASSPIQVSLLALRGGLDEAGARAPAGTPLELMVDAAGLDPDSDETPSGVLQVQIVSQTGEPVWTGDPTPMNSAVMAVPIDGSLDAGQYFVRLYRAPAGQGELLREFSLALE